jgi:dTDP-4-amino-4,6-dideoxygalactose transaminase
LKIFTDEIEQRNVVAARYSAALGGHVTVPKVLNGCVSAWAQYTIKVPAEKRDGLAAALKSEGIPTAIYYPKPLHQQTAYKHYPTAGNGLPVCDAIAREVISLPMHPYLEPNVQDRIIEKLKSALER